MTDKNLKDAMSKFYVEKANKQHFTPDDFLPAVTGGVLAAVFGAAIWGFCAILTGHELVSLSCIVGGLSGLGVILFSKSKRVIPLQVISVLSSILGILIVKYTFSYYTFIISYNKEGEIEFINNVSIFDANFMKHFAKSISMTLVNSDIFIILFALFIAWIIPKGISIQYRK
jgi:hypothetical protein